MKLQILKVLLALLFLIIFNFLFFFLLGTDVNNAVWVSYGFIHAAYLFILLTPLFLARTKASPILDHTIWMLSVAYFSIEFIVGTGFIIYAVTAHSENIVWPTVVQVIILALFLFLLLTNVMANETTKTHETQRISDYEKYQEILDELAELKDGAKAISVKRIIEKCWNEYRYGPKRTHPSVLENEHIIMNNISYMKNSLLYDKEDNQISIANDLLKAIQKT